MPKPPLRQAYKPKPNGKSNRTGVKSGPNAKRTGPPPVAINWERVGKLAAMQCTTKEICAVEGISWDTLNYRCEVDNGMKIGEFTDIHKMKGHASLRQAQFRNAIEKGNVAMQIWLGKNCLGQSDKIDHTSQEKPRIVLNYENPNGIDSHHEDRDSDGDAGILEIGRPNDDGEESI